MTWYIIQGNNLKDLARRPADHLLQVRSGTALLVAFQLYPFSIWQTQHVHQALYHHPLWCNAVVIGVTEQSMACVPCHWTKYCLLCEAQPMGPLSLSWPWNLQLAEALSSAIYSQAFTDCPLHTVHTGEELNLLLSIQSNLLALRGLQATELRPSLLTVLQIWTWAPQSVSKL